MSSYTRSVRRRTEKSGEKADFRARGPGVASALDAPRAISRDFDAKPVLGGSALDALDTGKIAFLSDDPALLEVTAPGVSFGARAGSTFSGTRRAKRPSLGTSGPRVDDYHARSLMTPDLEQPAGGDEPTIRARMVHKRRTESLSDKNYAKDHALVGRARTWPDHRPRPKTAMRTSHVYPMSDTLKTMTMQAVMAAVGQARLQVRDDVAPDPVCAGFGGSLLVRGLVRAWRDEPGAARTLTVRPEVLVNAAYWYDDSADMFALEPAFEWSTELVVDGVRVVVEIGPNSVLFYDQTRSGGVSDRATRVVSSPLTSGEREATGRLVVVLGHPPALPAPWVFREDGVTLDPSEVASCCEEDSSSRPLVKRVPVRLDTGAHDTVDVTIVSTREATSLKRTRAQYAQRTKRAQDGLNFSANVAFEVIRANNAIGLLDLVAAAGDGVTVACAVLTPSMFHVRWALARGPGGKEYSLCGRINLELAPTVFADGKRDDIMSLLSLPTDTLFLKNLSLFTDVRAENGFLRRAEDNVVAVRTGGPVTRHPELGVERVYMPYQSVRAIAMRQWGRSLANILSEAAMLYTLFGEAAPRHIVEYT